MNIITIGGSGLVGSRVTGLLSQKHNIKNLSTQTGVDITKSETLSNVANDTEYRTIILFAAKSDVDACEKDKELGEAGETYHVNVVGVQNVINACKKSNKKIIYISTDFVFDGENTPQNGYPENDVPKPVNWYARTKYMGELAVQNSGLPYLITRIGYPYRQSFDPKKDFLRAILSRLQNNLPVQAITDHIMSPTFIDDIAAAFDKLLASDSDGIFHVSGSQSLTPFDASILIAEKFNLDKSLISKTTREEFFRGRAPRPFNLTINNDKIRKLGVEMKRFDEALGLFL